jgi:prophage antirepressor-like protein
MNELTLFTSKENFKVRVIMWDGEPWFVAKDVCDILGLGNAREALRNLDDDERGSVRITDGTSPAGGNPNMNIVSESGLYTLIMRSNKPEAKAFRRWVTHEVLPSIRKTGRYVIPRKTHAKAEIEAAGKDFFMDCWQEGGIELYLEKRYKEECDPRAHGRTLTRQEKRWLEEAESAAFLAGEGRL